MRQKLLNLGGLGSAPTYRVLARWVVFAALAIVVLATGALSVIGQKVAYGPTENRRLEAFPNVAAAKLLDRGTFSKVNSWASDHQALRAPLIALNSATKLRVFDVPLDAQTIIGKDGYYFYGHGNMLRDFTRQARLEDDRSYLRGLLAYTRSLHAWAKETNRVALFVVTPNKHNIYEEYFSASHRFGGGPSTGAKIDAWLMKNVPDVAVPMTAPLREAKAAGVQVYYRTDTHWTPNGAKLGTDAILARSGALSPGLGFPEPPEYTMRRHVRTNGNFARLLSLPLTEQMEIPVRQGRPHAQHIKDFYRKIVPKHLPKKPRHLRLYQNENAKDGVRLLMIGDSFMSYMMGFTADAVGQALFYNPWGYGSDPELRFPKILMDRFDPNVVVVQLVERRVRPCAAGVSGDEDSSCQGSLVPRLPAFAATPRLRALFNGDSAQALPNPEIAIADGGSNLELKLASPKPPGMLAIARITLNADVDVSLAPADGLTAHITFERVNADLSPAGREAYVVLNVADGTNTVRLSASRPIAGQDVSVEVRFVPDDVDLEIPSVNKTAMATDGAQ